MSVDSTILWTKSPAIAAAEAMANSLVSAYFSRRKIRHPFQTAIAPNRHTIEVAGMP